MVLSFIDRINHTDLDGLVDLMTDDHRLVVLSEPPVIGRDANQNAWRGYMSSFPNYVIYPVQLVAVGDRVAVLGSTTGSHLALADDDEQELTVIWVGTVRNGKLVTWEIREESAAARRELGLAWVLPRVIRASAMARAMPFEGFISKEENAGLEFTSRQYHSPSGVTMRSIPEQQAEASRQRDATLGNRGGEGQLAEGRTPVAVVHRFRIDHAGDASVHDDVNPHVATLNALLEQDGC